MPGKDYADQADQISMQFDDLMKISAEKWQDEQARRFGYDHAGPISNALRDIRLPIECVIDNVEKNLREIQNIANGR